MTKLERAESLRIAAETRVAVLSLLENSETPLSAEELWIVMGRQFPHIETERKAFDSVLYNLKRNALIDGVRSNHPQFGVPIWLYFKADIYKAQPVTQPVTQQDGTLQMCLAALKMWRAVEDLKKTMAGIHNSAFTTQIEAMEKAAAKQRDAAITAADK